MIQKESSPFIVAPIQYTTEGCHTVISVTAPDDHRSTDAVLRYLDEHNIAPVDYTHALYERGLSIGSALSLADELNELYSGHTQTRVNL